MRKPYTLIKTDTRHPELEKQEGIFVPMLMIRVGSSRHAMSHYFDAHVDSGSPYCMFHSEIAEAIGIDWETGVQDIIGGIIAGPVQPVFFHRVQIYIGSDWVISVVAGFVKDLSVAAILGLNGFFDSFHVNFDHSLDPPVLEVQRIQKSKS